MDANIVYVVKCHINDDNDNDDDETQADALEGDEIAPFVSGYCEKFVAAIDEVFGEQTLKLFLLGLQSMGKSTGYEPRNTKFPRLNARESGETLNTKIQKALNSGPVRSLLPPDGTSLVFAVLIPENVHVQRNLWHGEFMILSHNDLLGHLSVFGVEGENVCLQSYSDGDFDSGFMTGDSEEDYFVEFEGEESEHYLIAKRDFSATLYLK